MEKARKLLVMQIKGSGIAGKDYSNLPPEEKALLEKKGECYFLIPPGRSKLRVGLTGGVFDILHAGHIFTLTEARKHCDFLAVAVAHDDFIIAKGRKLVHSQDYRTFMVESLKPVDVAIAGGKDFAEMLARVGPDVIIYGYDQKPFLAPKGVEVVQLKQHVEPDNLKSSKIIRDLGL